jgi:DNA-binding transcriptional regulator YiaG
VQSAVGAQTVPTLTGRLAIKSRPAAKDVSHLSGSLIAVREHAPLPTAVHNAVDQTTTHLPMSTLATALKNEMIRLARRSELRPEIAALRKRVAGQRKEIAALKRRLAEVERVLRTVSKLRRETPAKTNGSDETGHRFSASGLAKNRERLGLSATDFARLVGTTAQSIYAWEKGNAVPRPKFLPGIAALRGMGKRAVAARLSEMEQG